MILCLNANDIETKKAIPTMVQIPLERTEGEQASRLQVIAIKPNKILPKQAIIALSPEYFHQLWLPASDANLNTCKLRIPQECLHNFPSYDPIWLKRCQVKDAIVGLKFSA